jgi:hypothetical protein
MCDVPRNEAINLNSNVHSYYISNYNFKLSLLFDVKAGY